MEPLSLPTEAEIRTALQQGEAATLALIGDLLQMIAGLLRRIQELEDQQAKHSSNSSKPPSSDGLQKPAPRSLRQPSGKKRGAQPGHPGHRLELTPTPDHIEPHPVVRCAHCQAALTEEAVVRVEQRQEYELPPLRLVVTEHQAEVKRCPQCGGETVADFPAGITQPTQYGPDFKAFLVYLNQKQFIPLERLSEFTGEVFQQAVGEGTIVTANAEVAAVVQPVAARVQQYLIATEETVHFDESGLRVAAKLHWVHVASTPQVTYYHIDAKRGQEGMDRAGILPKRTGNSVHDDLLAYYRYPAKHGACNAHHLRELVFLQERYPQPWEGALAEHLLTIKQAVEAAREQGHPALSPEQCRTFEERYDELLAQGCALNPPPERPPGHRGRLKQTPPKNLLDRLHAHKDAVLAFMYDFKVPFDNNLAERDIRMVKLKQKISGCLRSEAGAQVFATIRGYLSTAQKNGVTAFAALKAALRGCPYVPDFVPPLSAPV